MENFQISEFFKYRISQKTPQKDLKAIVRGNKFLTF